MVAGFVWAFIWLGLGTLALSILLYSSSMPETKLLSWVFGVHGAASLAGGFTAAKRSGKRGWYIGAIAGLLYAVAVVLIGFLSQDIGFDSRMGLLGLIAALAGAFGGMLGVNAGAGANARRM
ncbi:TIGR04086 family membrane protein [Cohnella ginsengisoli]|uniref:TIGR04086 family membrane protein n=1 Tax=Cohnella ginsengisoli TaxID=425004 RepID=A0A9X4KI69_9BACL|nr:TIGR04086 family membrane protein [Cohnella ginsengisoli]MDG0790155.1 TIGR04086 family membrane protein [Cohnella ginsengisoli]